MKTPKELADEWANKEGDLWFADISTYTDGHKSAVKQGFLAGYKAAQEKYEARIKELEQAIIKSVNAMAGVQYDDENT
jgi:hypothetical protein